MANNKENKMIKKEVEVVELFDENGDSLVFELLSNIEDEGNTYFILTPFIEDESQIDPEIPAEVFVMQQVTKEGDEKMLEPIADTTLVEKIFDKFKNETKEKFDFADTDLVTKKVEQNVVNPLKDNKEDQTINVSQLNQATAYQRKIVKFREKKEFNDEILKFKRNIENLDIVVTSYKSIDSILDETLLKEFIFDWNRKIDSGINTSGFLQYFLSIFERDDFDTLFFLYNKDLLHRFKKEYSRKFRRSEREGKHDDQFITILNMMEFAINNDEKKQKNDYLESKNLLGFYSHLLVFSAIHNFHLFKNLIYNVFNDYDKICNSNIVIKAFKRLGEHFRSKHNNIALNSYKIAFILKSTLNETKEETNHVDKDLFLDIIRGVCNSYYDLRDYKSIINFMVDDINKTWKYPDLHISWLASGYIPYAREFAPNSTKRKEYIEAFYEVLKNTDENLIKIFEDGDLCNTAWYLDSLLYKIDILQTEEALDKINKIKDRFKAYHKSLSNESDYNNFLNIIWDYSYAIFDKIVIEDYVNENLDISSFDDAFSAIDAFMEDYYNYHKENSENNLESKMIKTFGVHYRISKIIKDFSNGNCKLSNELYRLIRCLYVVCETIKSYLAFKRNDDKDEKYDDIVYYTSLEALYYMLEDKRKDKKEELPSDFGKFQMYKFPVFNVWHLNDPQEGKLLFDKILTSNPHTKLDFPKFYEKYLLNKEEKDTFIFDDRMVFVKSFSRGAKESLPMWSHYGNDSKGCRVKLGIETFQRVGSNNETDKDFSFREKDDYFLYNIIYCTDCGDVIFKEEDRYIKPYFDMFKKIVASILDFYSKNDVPSNDKNKCNSDGCNKCLNITKNIYDILTPFAYLFKSANYDYERELRVILDRNEKMTHTEFKEITEKPFPRICIFMNNKVAIKEIMLGPKLNNDTVGSYTPFIRVQLEKMNSDAKIIKSKIQLK